MSLKPETVSEIPAETMRIAHAAFPKGTTITKLRDAFNNLYNDEDFKTLFPKRGQPALAPWRLALVTVFQFLENLSDRQAANAVRARIDWKYALSLELTDSGFHFSVLTEFRTRLIDGNAEHLLLDKMLEHFKTQGLVKARGKQRTDSTHVLGAVHDLHLLELVAETLRATLDDLATVVPDWLSGVVQPDWFKRYAHRIEDYNLPKTKEKREVFALEVGNDGFDLLDALDASDTPSETRQVLMVQTLRDVWRVHYERVSGRARWRAGAELPPVGERIQSPYDPQMHYSTKRSLEWSGYKVHVTETCDEDMVHVITHVKTCPAMQADMSSTAEIHEQLAKKNLLPSEHFVDSAYVDAELLVQSQQLHGVSLEGPVRGVSNWQTRTGAGYDLSHFKIDWGAKSVTCPQGKQAVCWTECKNEDGSPRMHARFSRTDCGTCTARSLCTPAKAARRSVYFHLQDEYEALNAARVRMNDPEWKLQYHVRAGIEGTLSQGVRAFGLRRSRYVGLVRTALQDVCIVAGMNVLRVVNWLDGVPRAKTRISKFMSLAPAA
jgi:transposase